MCGGWYGRCSAGASASLCTPLRSTAPRRSSSPTGSCGRSRSSKTRCRRLSPSPGRAHADDEARRPCRRHRPMFHRSPVLSTTAGRGAMEKRKLGKTGLEVSVLSFGCGAVGGLMTRGDPRDQEQAVARALELGINYFDTAALYGNGASETNLGRVLAKLKPAAIIATKVRVAERDRGRIGAAVTASLEASLKRLGRDS